MCAPLLRVDPTELEAIEPVKNIPKIGGPEFDFTSSKQFTELREESGPEASVPTEHDSRSPGGTLSLPPPDVKTAVPSEGVRAANEARSCWCAEPEIFE